MGNISYYSNLPMELKFEIFGFLDKASLILMRRVSKEDCSIFQNISNSKISLFKRKLLARNNLKTIISSLECSINNLDGSNKFTLPNITFSSKNTASNMAQENNRTTACEVNEKVFIESIINRKFRKFIFSNCSFSKVSIPGTPISYIGMYLISCLKLEEIDFSLMDSKTESFMYLWLENLPKLKRFPEIIYEFECSTIYLIDLNDTIQIDPVKLLGIKRLKAVFLDKKMIEKLGGLDHLLPLIKPHQKIHCV